MPETNLEFIRDYKNKVNELELDWDIYGMMDKRENIYSLTDDAKIVGRVFELLAAPAVRDVASDHGLALTPAESQTIYPDFTLEMDTDYDNEENGLQKGDRILELGGEEVTDREDVSKAIQNKDQNDKLKCEVSRSGNEVLIDTKAGEFQKTAVDVKTTYRTFYSRKYTYPDGETFEAGEPQPYTFTLGSFASFLRSYTKNIQYDYRSYKNHYIIGFIYTRNPDSEEGIVKSYEDRSEMLPPYQDVEYFVQHKHKIAGETPGSGNTENIGSFRTNSIDDLREGAGPFTEHGKDIYRQYWRNYPRYRSDEETFSNLEEFFEWRDEV